MCNLEASAPTRRALRRTYEPAEVTADPAARRITTRWTRISAEAKWLPDAKVRQELFLRDARLYQALISEQPAFRRFHTGGRTGVSVFSSPVGQITTQGLESSLAFISHNALHLVPGTPFANFMEKLHKEDHEWPLKMLVSFSKAKAE